MSAATLIRGDEVEVGDAIYYLGHGYLIERVEPYEHPTLGPARVAYTRSGWGITLFPDTLIEVTKGRRS